MGIGKMKKQTVCLFLSAILLFTAFLGIPVSAASGATVFQDVPNGMWYTNAVQYCNLIGLVSGYTDGTFRPDKNLTRAEMAVIMSKMLDLTEKSSNGFSDVQNGAWYTEPILKCVKAGVMSGYSGKKFGTNDTLTREQGGCNTCQSIWC